MCVWYVCSRGGFMIDLGGPHVFPQRKFTKENW